MSAIERYEGTQAVVIHQKPSLSTAQLQYIANTELVPRAYRGNMPAIMACVITGRALGLDEMTSLRMIYVVDGKATLSAELMVMAVRRHGHSITGESSSEGATAKGRRADTGDEMSVTWTLEDAKRAGLVSKQNWQKYPQAMLWARAVSQLVRMLFPDALLGLAYTPEEMGDDGSVVVEALEIPETDGPLLDDGRPALDGPGDVFDGVEDSGREPEEAGVVEEATNGTAAPAVISTAQKNRLHAIRNSVGMTTTRCKEIVLELTGQDSTAAIPRPLYDAVCAAIEAEGAGA